MECVRKGTPPWALTSARSDKVARTTPSMERILKEEVQQSNTSRQMCWCLLVQPMQSTSSSEAMCQLLTMDTTFFCSHNVPGTKHILHAASYLTCFTCHPLSHYHHITIISWCSNWQLFRCSKWSNRPYSCLSPLLLLFLMTMFFPLWLWWDKEDMWRCSLHY